MEFKRDIINIRLDKKHIFRDVDDDVDGLCWFYTAINSLFISDNIRDVVWKKVFVLDDNKPISVIFYENKFFNKRYLNKKVSNKDIDVYWYTISSIICYILKYRFEEDELCGYYEYLLNNIIYTYSNDVGYKFVNNDDGKYSGNIRLFILSFLDYYQLYDCVQYRKNDFDLEILNNFHISFPTNEYAHCVSFIKIMGDLYLYDINLDNYILKIDNLLILTNYLQTEYDIQEIPDTYSLEIVYDNVSITNEPSIIPESYNITISNVCSCYSDLCLEDFIF